MRKQDEVRDLIEKSMNPVFFYDDDPDGMVSYVLLKRKFGKGYGVIVRVRKGGVEEKDLYLRKIKEYCPDLVVFLDKPSLSQEIFDEIHVKKIWIDHHIPVKVRGVVYYNPRLRNKKNNKPTSYLCYGIAGEKRDLWLAAVGVTADWSDLLVREFRKKYPGFVSIKKGDPGDYLYKTKLGELAKIFGWILKGKTKDVKKAVSLLLKIKGPGEILEGKSEEGKELFERAEKFRKKYEKLLKEALKVNKRGKFLVFRYSTRDVSFSSELANELVHRYPKKIVVVARDAKEEVRMSLRSGKKGRELPGVLGKVLGEVGGRGGGHEHACAAIIKKEDFEVFMERFKEGVKK